MSSSPKTIVILGGGVCGLYAALTALRNGLKVVLLEKEEQVGGLAAGTRRGKNYYDMGVHMLHAFDQGIFDDISDLMASDRREVALDARIRWGGGTYRYPLKFGDLIREMPKLQLFRGVFGLIVAELKRAISSPKTKNAEEALIAFYGVPLYRFFFEEFTHRYWGIHPREISDEFIRRKMPRLSAVDFVRTRILSFLPQKAQTVTESSLEEETLHYSEKGAYLLPEVLEREIKQMGGIIYKNAVIQSVHLYSDQVDVETQSGIEISADYCLSTLPLNSFVSIVNEVPETVQAAARALKYKPIVVFGLLLNKEKALEGLYTYYRERIFHRVGEPKNAGLKVTPENHTVLIVEMTCEIGDEKWQCSDAVRSEVQRDLAEEGICEPEEIVEWHVIHYAHGYPVYHLGYEDHLGTVTDWMGQQERLRSTGRQGGFTYPGMHRAMRMGADAVESLISQND